MLEKKHQRQKTPPQANRQPGFSEHSQQSPDVTREIVGVPW